MEFFFFLIFQKPEIREGNFEQINPKFTLELLEMKNQEDIRTNIDKYTNLEMNEILNDVKNLQKFDEVTKLQTCKNNFRKKSRKIQIFRKSTPSSIQILEKIKWLI